MTFTIIFMCVAFDLWWHHGNCSNMWPLHSTLAPIAWLASVHYVQAVKFHIHEYHYKGHNPASTDVTNHVFMQFMFLWLLQHAIYNPEASSNVLQMLVVKCMCLQLVATRKHALNKNMCLTGTMHLIKKKKTWQVGPTKRTCLGNLICMRFKKMEEKRTESVSPLQRLSGSSVCIMIDRQSFTRLARPYALNRERAAKPAQNSTLNKMYALTSKLHLPYLKVRVIYRYIFLRFGLKTPFPSTKFAITLRGNCTGLTNSKFYTSLLECIQLINDCMYKILHFLGQKY